MPRRLVPAAAVLGALLGPFPAARSAGQDILCVPTNVRYDVPGECARVCRSRNRRDPMLCALKPECPALKGEPQLNRFYNAALFGTARVTPPRARDVVIAHLINRFFKPAYAGLFDIAMSPGISGWAEVSNRKNAAGKHALAVHPDLLLLSPGMIAGSVGHELVHYFQYQRTRTVSLVGLDAADTVFRELEASSWENGVAGFTWPHGPNRFFDCLVSKPGQDERKGVQDLLACRTWQAKKIIHDLRDSGRAGILDRLEKYLKDNPWTKAVWLPANPGWRTYTAGPRPSTCP